MRRFDQDAWFAGFADGEGSFLIISSSTGNADRRPGLFTRFSLGLRADDLPVLRELQKTFGGRLVRDERPQGRALHPANPRYTWHVTRKADLAGLVRYFDAFPLSAKKARDYDVWRAAVLIYCDRGGVETYDELAALRETLTAGRVYDAEAAGPPPAERAAQLGLDVIEGGA